MGTPANAWRVVLGLGCAQTLAWGSTYYLPAILAAPMAREIGVSESFVFAAFSAALAVAAVLGPFAGRRIDALGGRDVLSSSSVVFALGLAGLGLAQTPFGLVTAWFVVGLGMGAGLYEAAFATLARIYGQRARGAITGITLIAGLASTICWPLTAVIEAEAGWRMACLFWAGAHLVLGLPLNRVMVPPLARSVSFADESAAQDEHALRSVAPGERRIMLLLAIVFFVTWFVSTAMATHLPRLLQEAGATPAAAIAAAALIGPAQVAGRMLEFGLMRRVDPLVSARLAALAHPLGALLLTVLGAPGAAVFAMLHGAGNGILTIAKGTLPLAIFGPAGYGARQGLLMVPARFGQAAAPWLFALLIERFGTFALLFSVALGVLALGALLLLPNSTEDQHP